MLRNSPADGSLAVGCDVGGSEVKVVVLAARKTLARIRVPTPRDGSAVEIVDGIAALILSASAPFAQGRKVTLGVALPGFLDAARERTLHLQNLPALNGFPLKRALSGRTGYPVILDADSNAGAFGEARLGAGRGARRVLYLTLGTGVGAAMVVEGELVRVANHTVGQVAHLPLDPSGPRCSCGARGCIESVLGARGIVWRASRAAKSGARIPPGARRSPAALAEAAAAGSRGAARIFTELGSLLGAALAMLSNFLSPERIVLGGGIARAGEHLLGPARSALLARVHPRLRGGLTLVPARLGLFSGATGAALLGGRKAEGGDRKFGES